MKVEIGRLELQVLAASVGHTGADKNPGNEWMFELRPFVNGNHWRLTSEAISTSTDQQLFDLYLTHSPTIKQL
ncbi:MAG: hypothetical protein ABI067_07045 [Leifsonia sp.]